MASTLHMEQRLPYDPTRVFAALTDDDALAAWFAEHADVALDERRYDFWGRYTPECPDRATGRHRLSALEEGTRFEYGWTLRGGETTVSLEVASTGDETAEAGAAAGAFDGATAGTGAVVILHHADIPSGAPGMASYAPEDVWYLAFENLRRHLAGRPVIRCDFSKDMTGTIEHRLHIDGPPEAVWHALTDPAQLERWIASTASVDLSPGGRFDLGWGDEGVLEVRSAEPERRLELAWMVFGDPTVVTFELEPKDGGTELRFRHEGFAADEPVAGLDVGWLHYLAWVQSMVEFGADWAAAVKEISEAGAVFYAASQWARQKLLVGRRGK